MLVNHDRDLIDAVEGRVGGLTRRRFLRAAVFGAAGTLVLPRVGLGTAVAAPEAQTATDCLPIWAAAFHDGGYYGLANNGTVREIHQLDVDKEGNVTLGRSVAASVVDAAELSTIGSVAGRLFVAGGVWVRTGEIVVDNRPELYPDSEKEAIPDGIPLDLQTHPVMTLQPVLYEVAGGGVQQVKVPVPDTMAFGMVQAVTAVKDDNVAVIVGGTTDEEITATERIDLFETFDNDDWKSSVVSTGLYGTGNVFAFHAGTGLWTVFVDHDGSWRSFNRAAADAEFIDATPKERVTGGDVEVLAVVTARGGDAAVAIRDGQGNVGITGWDPGTDLARTANPFASDVVDVVGVEGAAGQVIVVAKGRSQLVEL